jgi:hypothetical protein
VITENNYRKKMIVLRAERLPTTWTITLPTFRVRKSAFEKRNPQVWIAIGDPPLCRYGLNTRRRNVLFVCVIAGTDCGLGGHVHPQIARAKLRATARRSQARIWGS